MSNRARIAAAALVAALALSACSGSDDDADKSANPPGSGSTTPHSSGLPNKPGQGGPKINPLTGGKPSKNGVVAVKIDDTGNGRPQVGIDKADVVYIEQVEGGLTRLLAVFNSTLPTVEAVRSTRPSDPELVGSYGHIAYVASGGAYNPLKILDGTKLKTSINDRGGPGFIRDGGRPIPYNLRADLGVIAKKLKAPHAQDVGFAWSYSKDQLKGRPGGLYVRTVVGSTSVGFDFNPKSQRYNRLIGGVAQRTANGTPITASNVVVQYCDVEPYYKNRDVNGSPAQFTHTIGKGKAVLFRNGKRVNGLWSRKHYTGGTAFTDVHGKKLLFRPGNVWVVLVKRGAPLS